MAHFARQIGRTFIRVFSPVLLLLHIGGTSLGALPITFEENRGQAPPEVAFLARTSGGHLFLTRQAAVIALPDGHNFRIRLAGSENPAPLGGHLLLTKTNYLVGPDAARWKRNIANYDGVTYPQVYPGIDLTWHAQGDQIEHDYLVAAGANPRRIRLRISGAALRLDYAGDLMAGSLRLRKPRAYQGGREVECRYELHGRSVHFALGQYNRALPLLIDPVLSFSTYIGATKDQPVGSALDASGNFYVAGTTSSVQFPVTPGAFQVSPGGGQCSDTEPFGGSIPRPCTDIFVAKFIADGSTLLYATYLGGPGDDKATAVAVSPAGNLYVVGTLTNSQWLPKLIVLPGQTAGSNFVAELSVDGSSVLTATSLPVIASAIAVDAAGAVYLTGMTDGGSPMVNAIQPAPRNANLFQSPDTGHHWQPFMNGLPQDPVRRVAADPLNPQVLYVATATKGLYKTSDGGEHWSSIGNLIAPNAMVSALLIDPHSPQTLYLSGPGVIYKSTDGGANWTLSGPPVIGTMGPLALDPEAPSTLYTATTGGVYKSVDGAATWNPTGLKEGVRVIVVDPTNGGTIYAASGTNGIMKSTDGGATWSPMGTGIPQSSYIPSLAIDPASPQTLFATTITIDGLYMTTDGGAHWNRVSLAPQGGSVQLVLIEPGNPSRLWVATTEGVLTSVDSGATWTRTPFPHLTVTGLTLDAAGDIYATTPGLPQAHPFVMKLDATSSNIAYATYLGGFGNDLPYGLAVDGAGRTYLAGVTDSPDFPLAAALQPQFGGNSDAFISVLDPSGARLVWSTYLGGSSADAASSIAIDTAGNVHVAGVTSPSYSAGINGGGLFASKIKSDGSGAIFSVHPGGTSFAGARVAADAAGNTYVAGTTTTSDLPTVNPLQPVVAGGTDLYVAELNGQTGALQFATFLGGAGNDSPVGVAADASGGVYVAGRTTSNFPLQNALQSSAASTFVAKIAVQGSLFGASAVTSAASYGPTIAPGELVSLFGAGLAAGTASAASLPLPTQLSDVHVTVNGIPAPLVYTSPQQLNAQIPFETQTGTAQVQVTSGAGTSMVTATVAATAPGIFTLNQQGTGAGAILHGLTYQLVNDSNPAAAGEIISIYCTGLGALNPPAPTGDAPPAPPSQTVAPVQISIAGMMAPDLYAGVAPGFTGLYQVNAQLPMATPSGAQPVQIIQNGVASNPVTVAVK